MAHAERFTPNKEIATWKEHSTGFSSVSVFLSDDQGRLLMVQDLDVNGGKWSPIAGYVDDLDHEEPEMAALREAKEEMGLDIRIDNLLGVWHYYTTGDTENDGKPHVHVGYAYTGTILDGTYQLQKSELQNYGFFTPAEFDAMLGMGMIKTPEYNAQGYKLWSAGTRHPRSLVVTKKMSELTP